MVCRLHELAKLGVPVLQFELGATWLTAFEVSPQALGTSTRGAIDVSTSGARRSKTASSSAPSSGLITKMLL